MKIHNFVFYNNLPLQNKKETYRINLLNQPCSDTFVKCSKKISFGGEPWDSYLYINNSKFDPVNATDKELEEYARILHKWDDIDKLIEERYFVYPFSCGRKEKQRISKLRLKPLIEKVINEKRDLLIQSNDLTQKAALGTSNIAQQKLRLQQNFLKMLDLAKRNSDLPIPNGIFIYGTAWKNDKDEFIRWLKDEAGAKGTAIAEVEFNPDDPKTSFDQINQSLSTAKSYYNMFGERTILHLKDIDRLLTNVQDEESLDWIDTFKMIAETCSKKYNTTLLVNTDLPLVDFDSASISRHRFENHIFLKEGLTEKDKKELSEINAKLDELDKAALRSSEFCCYRPKVSKSEMQLEIESHWL